MNFRSILIAVAAAMTCVACSSETYQTIEGATWGTEYHITYRSDKDLCDSVTATLRRVELSLSPFEKQSVISRINNGDTSVRADSMLATVFTEAQRICRISDGAFDPTVAPLINLWGFGYKKSADTDPSQAQIDSALLTVGLLDCQMTADRCIVKKHPLTEFNFSAITKGYGVDCVADMLERNGCHDYMVEIGGEVRIRGVNSEGRPWRIQIDAPKPENTTVSHQQLTAISPGDRSVATSGNYRNYRTTSDGRTVAHTISPRDGRPVNTNTLSATVVAPKCITADAMATACMAMPSDKAIKMIENEPDCEALLVLARNDGTYDIVTTSGFASTGR